MYVFTHTCTPILQLCLLQSWRKSSTVLSGCPTCIDVHSQVTQQLVAGKVVKNDMVVSALQVLCEVFDYSLTSSFLPLPSLPVYT